MCLMEINPRNQTLTQLRDHWQKMFVLVMVKLGVSEIDITEDDIAKLNAGGSMPFLVTHGHARGVKFILKPSEREALEYLMRQQSKG